MKPWNGKNIESVNSQDGNVDQQILTEIRSETFPQTINHLQRGFFFTKQPLSPADDSLPYHQLSWEGFERLCYLLLLDQENVPRYFGNHGQEQYGIDLLVTQSNKTIVYQCKNLRKITKSIIKEILESFESQWLGKPYLPKPTEFVLCCPLPIRDLKLNEFWTTTEREFQARTGVNGVFWDREYLDERLRKLPDVVADLFSDRIAEHFCHINNWKSDIFRPLISGSGDSTVSRYLTLRDTGRVYIDPKIEKDFSETLLSSGSLLVRGEPGSGKTITGLALAESLHHILGYYRIFYVSLKYAIAEDLFVEGIRRRLTRPSIFFIDDCQGNFDKLYRIHNRAQRIQTTNPGKGLFIFISRITPNLEDELGGYDSDFEKGMAHAKALIDFHSTPDLFRQIITRLKPELVEIPQVEKYV